MRVKTDVPRNHLQIDIMSAVTNLLSPLIILRASSLAWRPICYRPAKADLYSAVALSPAAKVCRCLCNLIARLLCCLKSGAVLRARSSDARFLPWLLTRPGAIECLCSWWLCKLNTWFYRQKILDKLLESLVFAKCSLRIQILWSLLALVVFFATDFDISNPWPWPRVSSHC